MKRIITIALATLFTLSLSACKDDIKDISTNEVVAESIAGESIHTPVFAKSIDGGMAKLGQDIYSINLAMDNGGPVKTGVTLVCDLGQDGIGVATNIKDSNGRVVSRAVDFSVMKYKAGIKTITERDEQTGVTFSTSDGDTDIIKFLTVDLQKLPGDSYVAFTLDVGDAEGYTVTGGWSPLVKVKDLNKLIGKFRTDVCGKSKLAVDQGEWLVTFTDDDVRQYSKR